MDCNELIAKILKREGVEWMACFPSNPLIEAVAKEGIRALTKVAAREWGQHKINVNAICPAADTPSFREWRDANPELAKEMVDGIPLGHLGDPEADIGRAVVFLASDDADFVTGVTMMVDGGQTILH